MDDFGLPYTNLPKNSPYTLKVIRYLTHEEMDLLYSSRSCSEANAAYARIARTINENSFGISPEDAFIYKYVKK